MVKRYIYIYIGKVIFARDKLANFGALSRANDTWCNSIPLLLGLMFLGIEVLFLPIDSVSFSMGFGLVPPFCTFSWFLF